VLDAPVGLVVIVEVVTLALRTRPVGRSIRVTRFFCRRYSGYAPRLVIDVTLVAEDIVTIDLHTAVGVVLGDQITGGIVALAVRLPLASRMATVRRRRRSSTGWSG